MELPLDILQEFALWSLPDEPTGSIKETPVCFSHVCASWRQAALSMPRIWSRLCVKLEGTIDSSTSKDLQLRLIHFFVYANGHALTLHITFSTTRAKNIPETTPTVRKFVDWMFHVWPRMPEIRHLTIVSAFPWHEIVDGVTPPHLPLLETLVLSNHKQRLRKARNNCWIAHFYNTPRLRFLTIDHSMLKNPITDLLRWSRLEKIYLADTIPAPDWISILDVCSNMRSGYFHVSGSLPVEPHNSHIQDRCWYLQKLTIAFRNIQPHSFNILQKRRLPNLARLTCRFPDRNERSETTDPYHLKPYLPKLTQIFIYEVWNFPICLRTFLIDKPSSVLLLLWVQESYTPTLWPLLTIADSDSRPMLPLLSSIKVVISPHKHPFRQGLAECDTLEAMLRSRTIPNHRFNVAKLSRLYMTCKITDDVEKRLCEMRETYAQIGVDLVIKNAEGSDGSTSRPPGHTSEYSWDR